MEKLLAIEWSDLELVATPKLPNPTIGGIIGKIVPYIYLWRVQLYYFFGRSKGSTSS